MEPTPSHKKDLFTNIINYRDFYLMKDSIIYKILLGRTASQILIKSQNYLSHMDAMDLSVILGENFNSLDEAYLVGNFDRVYASETLYQIQILLALENDIRTQTDNNSLATVLDQSINDLTILETNYKNFIAK